MTKTCGLRLMTVGVNEICAVGIVYACTLNRLSQQIEAHIKYEKTLIIIHIVEKMFLQDSQHCHDCNISGRMRDGIYFRKYMLYMYIQVYA